MAEIIAIANQKGGVGKTTSTINLGAAFKEMGHRVLLLDLDPQGHLTMATGNAAKVPERNIYNVLIEVIETDEPETMDALPILTNDEGLDIIPSNLELSNADLRLMAVPVGGSMVLQDALVSVHEAYDFILIDCPPYLGMLTVNALTAADRVIIPMQTDFMALNGLSSLTGIIKQIWRRNKKPEIGGIFFTIADMRLTHTKDIIEAGQRLKKDYRVFNTIIRESVVLKEAPVVGQSILAYDRASTSADEYRALAQEILNG